MTPVGFSAQRLGSPPVPKTVISPTNAKGKQCGVLAKVCDSKHIAATSHVCVSGCNTQNASESNGDLWVTWKCFLG